jgi:RND family efflux transporter MFP subunit
MMKNLGKIDFALIAFALVACGCRRTHEARAVDPLPAVVGFSVIESAPAPQWLLGEIVAGSERSLGFRVQGILGPIRVRTGDVVHRGDLLAVLDGRDAKARMAAAEETTRLAEAERGRTAALTRAGAIANVEDERRSHDLEQARASLTLARNEAAAEELRAPIDGAVVRRYVEPGEIVSPGTPVVALAETGRRLVRTAARVSELNRLAVGTSLTLRAPQGTTAPAVVSSLAPSPDARTGLFTVEAALDASSSLAVGTLVDVDLAPDAPLPEVPSAAVVHHADADRVCVLDTAGDGRVFARWRSVEVARVRGTRTWVRSGLRTGEQVAGEGSYFVRDNEEVRVIQP